MCVIIYHQRKHKTIPLEALQNAIHNNPHGVGLVRFSNKRKLIVTKYLPKDLINGPNAEALHKELTQLENHSYILHLRNTTAGENSKENLHPFELYKGTKGHFVMMHNGTLFDYADKDSKESDTQRFVEDIAKPLTEMHVNSFPDKCLTSNPFAMNVLEKYRSAQSRFIIISGDKRVMRLGTWYEKPFGTCSNDDYFHIVKRGPHEKKTYYSQNYKQNYNSYGGEDQTNRIYPKLLGAQEAFWKQDFYAGPPLEETPHIPTSSFFS